MLGIFPQKIEVKELRKQVAELQNSVSILLGDAVISSTTRGNQYRVYETAIKALADKYDGVAEWGVLQVRNIVDLRSAFIIGQGIKITCEDKESRELEFINDFVKLNNLDEEMPQELAKEAEIDGRALVTLKPNEDKTQIEFRYLSYANNKYKVYNKDNDYQKYDRVEYKTSSQDIVIQEKDFIYKKFAGRIDKVNDIMPKVAMVLRQCEDLDKALVDWREANNYFGSPTPYFKCVDENEVKKTRDGLKASNWRIGKSFIGTADFKMVEMSGSGLMSIKEEIIKLAEFISGATGIPVHFLGLPELMSNRATSTDLFELINASTNKERHVWEGFYEELFDKVLLKANELYKFGFKTGKVKAKVLAITEAQIKQIAEVWLPLYNANVVDLDFIIGKIPDADPDMIKANLEENAVKLLDHIKTQETYEEKLNAAKEGVVA